MHAVQKKAVEECRNMTDIRKYSKIADVNPTLLVIILNINELSPLIKRQIGRMG